MVRQHRSLENTTHERDEAWRFDRYGGSGVMQQIALPVPQPKVSEVLVKVLASGVKKVSGHFKAPMARVRGRDFAGVIVARAGNPVPRPLPIKLAFATVGWSEKADLVW